MKKLILSFLLLLLPSQGLADEVVTLKNGDKVMLLDSGRWAVMGSREKKGAETSQEIKPMISNPENSPEAAYMEIKLIDLKHEINALAGKKIRTEAFGVAYEFMLVLKQDKMDSSPLEVNINRLSQEARKSLREACLDGCNVTVYGRVGAVIQGDEGVIADKVDW